MRIGFIGAGKVGVSFGKYLAVKGEHVTGYYSKTPKSAMEASEFTGTGFFRSIGEITAASDLLFLSVPDSAIGETWEAVKEASERLQIPLGGKIICHLSGALPSGIFTGIREWQAYGYSTHPLLAVSSKHDSYNAFSQALFTIEGDSERLGDIISLFRRTGNKSCVIDKTQRPKYHAAAVFLSNHIAALSYVGTTLLTECGISESDAGIALKTLFLKNCENIAEKGIIDALTGPVERNDTDTVEKHLECLEGNTRLLYRLLSSRLIEIAQMKHRDCDYTVLKEIINRDN